MESEEPREHQKRTTESKEEEPKLPSVITTNGIAIKSKLNPDAKEFYPSYMLQRSVQVCKREVNVLALEQIVLPQGHLAMVDIVKVDEADNKAAIACEKDMPKAEQAKQNDSMKVEEKEEKIVNIAEMARNAEAKAEQVEAENKVEHEASAEHLKPSVLEKQKDEEVKKLLMEEKVEENTSTYEAPKETMNIAELIDDEIKAEVEIEEIEIGKLLLQEEQEKEQEKVTSAVVAEVASFIKVLEPPVLTEIIEETKETTVSVCGDTQVVAERVGDNSNATEEIGDCVENNEQTKVTTDPGFVMQINPCDSGTNIKPEECCAPQEESRVPPTTPNEDVHESLTGNSKKLKENLLAAKALEKKKSEKRSAVRKLSNIALGLARKSATSTTSSGEKTTTATSNTTKSSSTASMSRTKRISESLHNLSTTLKSKSETKKSDSSTKPLPRSTTSIPKPPVRSRTLLSKGTADSNSSGTRSLKDAVSLKSTSSAERSFSSRSSTHSSSSKTLNSKSSGNNTKSTDKSADKTTSKSKDGTAKVPRGTVASSLRQTEAQKRRNLFPNDLDDPDTNIELSNFLFK